MKRVQYQEYGGPEVMKMEEVERPKPGPNQVLIHVKAAGINEVDWKMRNGNLKLQDGTGFPKAMGCECAGDVIAMGEKVQRYRIGDPVFGWIPFNRLGGFAEYAVLDIFHRIPPTMNYAQAAALPMVGTTALHAISHEPDDLSGKKVLINGGTGGVGHLAVQVARVEQAHITATAGPDHVAFATQLGADRVIDYTQYDVTTEREAYDVILDTSAKLSWDEAKPMLRPGGIYIDLQPGLKAFVGSFIKNLFSSKSHDVMGVTVSSQDLIELVELVDAGLLQVKVGKVYPFRKFNETLAALEANRDDFVGKAVFEVG